MATKHFKYPPIFQIVKVLATVIMILVPVLIIIVLLQSDYSFFQEEYRIATLSIPFTILLCVLIVGSMCEIKTDADGLYVEFFWKYLFVPWEKIKAIKYVGFRPGGYWIISTNNALTRFHWLYSIGTFPLRPSFHLHDQIESRSMLLSIIKEKISNNEKLDGDW